MRVKVFRFIIYSSPFSRCHLVWPTLPREPRELSSVIVAGFLGCRPRCCGPALSADALSKDLTSSHLTRSILHTHTHTHTQKKHPYPQDNESTRPWPELRKGFEDHTFPSNYMRTCTFRFTTDMLFKWSYFTALLGHLGPTVVFLSLVKKVKSGFSCYCQSFSFCLAVSLHMIKSVHPQLPPDRSLIPAPVECWTEELQHHQFHSVIFQWQHPSLLSPT